MRWWGKYPSIPTLKWLFSEVKAFQDIYEGIYHAVLFATTAFLKLLAVEDERILYVKLADRLHNMRKIEGHRSLAKRQRKAEETLQCFVPMARQLGVKPIEKELQELSCAVLSKKKLAPHGAVSKVRVRAI